MKITDKKDITTPTGGKATRISFTDDNNGKYSCYVYDTGKIQVTTLHPYDDADYHWALSNNGENFKIILNKKVVGNISVAGDLDNKLDLVSKELAGRNKDIKSRMMYESKFLNEDWRDGSFSHKEVLQYTQHINQDFSKMMFSVRSMIEKFPDFTPEFISILDQFKDVIEISLEEIRSRI